MSFYTITRISMAFVICVTKKGFGLFVYMYMYAFMSVWPSLAARARAFKDVAIYEPQPLSFVRVCVCARTDSVSWPECGGYGGGTTPPAHVLYRCRHRGALCTCAQGSWRWAGRRRGFVRSRPDRTVVGLGPRPVTREPLPPVPNRPREDFPHTCRLGPHSLRNKRAPPRATTRSIRAWNGNAPFCFTYYYYFLSCSVR